MSGVEKEELLEMIRQSIREFDAERMSHPTRRERVTRFTDPDGKTWVSTTLEKAEVIRKALLVGAAIIGATVALVQFTNRWFLVPTMDERAASIVAAHESEVRAEMAAVTPGFVTKAEFDRRVAASDGRWDTQEEFNKRVAADLAIMQADIKEILKRLR